MNVGLCLSDPHPDHMGDGSKNRTLSASRFCGRYRIVDFVLSNMVNSGVFTIGIILNSHFQSLIGHIGMGKEWDLARKTGGVAFFPSYMTDERQSINNEPNGPLSRACEFLTETNAEFVILADSSVIYNMDYRDAIEAHKKSGADVTAIYTSRQVTKEEAEFIVAFDIADDGRVTGVATAVDVNININANPKHNVSLGAYIIPKKHFLDLIAGDNNCGVLKFSRVHIAGALDRLRVMAHEHKGYTAQICSLDTFFYYNMDILDIEKRNLLFDYGGRRIFTSRRDSLPTKYGKSAEIKNSIIADGCRIDGIVENSVISRYVEIGPGTVIKNCILQESTIVEGNTQLDHIITDRGVRISENRSLAGCSTYPVYVERFRNV